MIKLFQPLLLCFWVFILVLLGVGVSEISDARGLQPAGSGFIINTKGTVMTAAHVIRGYRTMYIRYNGTIYPTKLVYYNNDQDLAVLQTTLKTPYYFGLGTDDSIDTDISVTGYPQFIHTHNDTFNKHFTTMVTTVGKIKNQFNLTMPHVFGITANTCHGDSGGPCYNRTYQALGLVSYASGAKDTPCSDNSYMAILEPIIGVLDSKHIERHVVGNLHLSSNLSKAVVFLFGSN
jgi:S1-C subfamily serine protease